MFTNISEELAADPWFKIVDFLQQNWAVIVSEADSVRVVFFGDTCGVFDEISFESVQEAEDALLRNGFNKYRDDPKAADFIAIPTGEFSERPHPNGPIYSSGRFWR